MTTRQELYDRIRQSSKDEVILEEMIRLGFWPRGGTLPEDPADEIREIGELQRELKALTSENARLHNATALKKALRKQRLEESKRKRKENKERRLKERAERSAAWQEKKKHEITFLGSRVSKGLGQTQTNAEKLRSQNIPIIEDASALAAALETSVNSVRFLAYDRAVSAVSHYQKFEISKKTGGRRLISAPMPRLKRVQEWILHNILNQIALHPAAHGFRTGRSIVTNAQPHVGAKIVVNLDLEDFFPSIIFPRVRGLFRSMGYSEAISTVLALLCSEPETRVVGMDGERYHVAKGVRRLPQGAPTSPALTNILCRGMDARLTQIAESFGAVYTRYADDLTFSFRTSDANVGGLLRRVKFVIRDENLKVHHGKTRVQREGRRREVTGLVVNEKLSVPRDLLKKFRATLFQIEKDGPAGKRWGQSPNAMAAVEGFANFVMMVEPEKGVVLQQTVRRLIEKYGVGLVEQNQRQRWVDKAPQESAAAENPADHPTATGEPLAQGKQGEGKDSQPAQSRQEADPPVNPPVSNEAPRSEDNLPSNKPWWKLW